MGLSEYLQMRRLDKEAADIKKTLRENGRHTGDTAKATVRHERDEYGRKNYRKTKGGKTPALSPAQERALVKRAKKVEADLKKAKKQAKGN